MYVHLLQWKLFEKWPGVNFSSSRCRKGQRRMWCDPAVRDLLLIIVSALFYSGNLGAIFSPSMSWGHQGIPLSHGKFLDELFTGPGADTPAGVVCFKWSFTNEDVDCKLKIERRRSGSLSKYTTFWDKR